MLVELVVEEIKKKKEKSTRKVDMVNKGKIVTMFSPGCVQDID